MTATSSSRSTLVLPLVFAIAAATGVSGIPQDAMAQAARTSQRVKVSDLDLSTQAGQRRLNLRIDATARKVCQLEELRTGLNIRPTEAVNCYRLAREATHERVAEMVTAARQGRQPAQVRIEKRADLP